MPWWYPIVRDVVFGLVGVGLIGLLLKERAILRGQIKTLEQSQKTFLDESDAMKKRTDQLLALYDRMSTEKLVQELKATQELYGMKAEATIAEAERKVRQQAVSLQSEKESEAQKAKLWEGRASYTVRLFAESVGLLGLALYRSSKDFHELVLSKVKDEFLRGLITSTMDDLTKSFGPFPADVPRLTLAEIFRMGPQALPPESGKVRYGLTNPTPGTPKDPGGETRTSP